ncbi:MAG: TIGR00730 family Rossman fold protein [Ilumatobacteraceae bacterium]
MCSEPTSRVCVYCGSNAGTSPSFGEAALQLGSALAHRGIGLVYGGGHVGLMGIVADAALAADGEVIGVITEQLVRAEVAHDRLTRLEVVPTMHDRKARLTDLADGFVVLPGGFGTVDEFAEAVTWNQLGLIAKPVVLLDIDGYWGPIFEWMSNSVEAGFVRDSHRMLAQRAHTIDEAIALATAPVPDVGHKWIDRDVTSSTGVPRLPPN